MPIAPTDIVLRLSGGASNTSPAASLGGAKSSTAAGTNIFDNVSSAESTSGDDEYRQVYVHNNHATLALENATAYLSAAANSGSTTLAIGVGTSAVNGTEQTVADEGTAPAGVTFSAPNNVGAALALGTIPAGQHRALWVRRHVNAGAAAVTGDGATIRIDGGYTE